MIACVRAFGEHQHVHGGYVCVRIHVGYVKLLTVRQHAHRRRAQADAFSATFNNANNPAA